jgi:hypothetical protein
MNTAEKRHLIQIAIRNNVRVRLTYTNQRGSEVVSPISCGFIVVTLHSSSGDGYESRKMDDIDSVSILWIITLTSRRNHDH